MLRKLFCLAWGHAVDNETFLEHGRSCTRCGRTMLEDDEAEVRIGHTLSCFFRHHTYEEVGRRNGHTEYACVRCGHPLLFRSDADPYAGGGIFDKRVRYLCGLFGHRVHVVTERSGGIEYACHCGHTFVQQPQRQMVVHHPLSCVLLGHWVRVVGGPQGPPLRSQGAGSEDSEGPPSTQRVQWTEYACRTCGHPFLFKRPAAGHSSLLRRAAA